MEINQIIILIIIQINLFLFLFSGYRILHNYINHKNKIDYYQNAHILFNILQNAKDISYDKIFREEIAVYNMSGTRLNNEELVNVSKKYLKSVLSIIGDTVLNDAIYYYGSFEVLCQNLMIEFVNRVANDEKSILNINE